ncbi:MAG: NADPH:quinone reductase [Pirellulaceae bacterium]
MKAAFIEQTGDPDVIQFGDLPKPEPQAGQVLIRGEAVSVNPVDTYVRSGAIAMELPKPFIIGCDLAGTVEAIGDGVTGLRPGDRVWTTNQGLLGRQGTFAEYSAVDKTWVYPIPDGIESSVAVACALVGVTAHLGLVRDARLAVNETVFVVGGTGGVGSMVVQMAKISGAKVITTAGSDEKCEIAKNLGADHVIQYRKQSIEEELKELAPEGVDVFWETRREPDFDLTVAALAPRGRMILMAGREARPPFPVGPFYVKGCSLHGFAMFNATSDEMRQAAEDINAWFAAEQLQALIGKIMPLSQAAEAHRLQEESTLGESGTLIGKIVLEV